MRVMYALTDCAYIAELKEEPSMHRTARTVSAALAISLACGLTACGSGVRESPPTPNRH